MTDEQALVLGELAQRYWDLAKDMRRAATAMQGAKETKDATELAILRVSCATYEAGVWLAEQERTRGKVP